MRNTEEMLKVLRERCAGMEERFLCCMGNSVMRNQTVYDNVIANVYILGRIILRDRKKFGFSVGESVVESEEEVFKEDLEFLGFLECVLDVLNEGKEMLKEDFSGWSREWFLMEMYLRFGLQEEEVKSFVCKTIREGVRRRLGTIDIRRPVSESNCFLSLLSVF